MQVIADISITPVGTQTSLTEFIRECEKIIHDNGLKSHVHAFGTNIEGDWNLVMQTIKDCLQELHKKGVTRVLTTVRLDTRTDHNQSIEKKISSVS